MRRSTSIAAYIRDLGASKSAQRWYRRRAAELRDDAHQAQADGKPLTARRIRYESKLADHAARAEFFDPEP